jgi:NAD(P)-dependent dehydrogenase (short-subunit alcohol dehydrogenase family)
VAGKLEGKVAFITGAARGQGRSHAVRLAAEGADIIAVDICRQIDSVTYPMSTPEDLAQTVKEVEALDRRIVARQADVRDEAGLRAAFDVGVAELGPVDIVLANAGIAPMSMHEIHQAWQDVIDVNLTGVFNTRPAPPRAPCCARSPPSGACRWCSSRATPTSPRRS